MIPVFLSMWCVFLRVVFFVFGIEFSLVRETFGIRVEY